MTPNERSMIEELYNRIRTAQMPPRDPEAERLIGEEMARTPGAAYALTQTVLVQDHALREAAERVRQLEAALQAQHSQAPAFGRQDDGQAGNPGQDQGYGQPASGSILDRLGLGGGRPGAVPRTGPQGGAPPAAPEPAAGPFGGALGGGGGGGFLRGAMQTAAGVAGGALLFEGVRSLFGGGGGGSPWGGGGAAPWGEAAPVDQAGGFLTGGMEDEPDSRDAAGLDDDADAGDDGDWGDDGGFDDTV